MEPQVRWPESLYDRVMRARIAVSDVFARAIDREVEQEVAETVQRSAANAASRSGAATRLGHELFGGGGPPLQPIHASHSATDHEAVCAALKSLEFDVVKVIQTLADSLPSFQPSESDDEKDTGRVSPPPTIGRAASRASVTRGSVRVGAAGGHSPRGSDDLQTRVITLEAKLKRSNARTYDFRAKCSHLEFQVEALKAHCLRKDGAVEYIRKTLFQEVVALREQLHRQQSTPGFVSDFVSLFDYTKLLEGSTPPSAAAQEALRVLKKEHAAEVARLHAAHAAAMRVVTDESERLRKELLQRRESDARLRSDPSLPEAQGPDHAEYREQFRALHDVLSTRDATIDGLRGEIDGLQEELRGQQQIAKGLKDQLARMNDEVEDIIEVKNREIVAKVQLVADLEAKVSAMDSVRTQLQLSTAKNEKLSVEIIDMRTRLSGLEAQVPALEAERDDLLKRNQKLAKHVEKLESQGSDQAAVQQRVMQGTITKLEEKLAKTEHELSDARERLDFTASELAHAQQELRMVSGDAQTLRTQVATLRESIAATQGDYSNSAVLAEDRERTIQQLQTRLAERGTKIGELEAVVAVMEEQAASLRNELHETRARVASGGGQLMEDLTTALQRGRQLADDNAELKRRVEFLGVEAGELRDRIVELEVDLDAARVAAGGGGGGSAGGPSLSSPTTTALTSPKDASLGNPVRTYAYNNGKRPPSAGRRGSGAGLASEMLDRQATDDRDSLLTSASPVASPTVPETISKAGVKHGRSGGAGGSAKTGTKKDGAAGSPKVSPGGRGAPDPTASSEALMGRIASLTSAKAEAEAQAVLLAAQVAQLKEALAKHEKDAAKPTAAAPAVAQAGRAAAPASLALTTKQQQQQQQNASRAIASSPTRAAQAPLASAESTTGEQHPSATVSTAEVTRLRQELARLEELVQRLQAQATTSKLITALSDRCAVACGISGARYPAFSDAARAIASELGVLAVSARQDRGRVVLSGTFPRVSDGFEWARRLLRRALTDSHGAESVARVQIGVTHGLCAVEDGVYYGPAPTRAVALATVANTGTMILSAEAAERLELERAAGNAPPAAPAGPTEVEVEASATLRCMTDANQVIKVRCVALGGIGGDGLTPSAASIVPDTSAEERAVWDPLPVLSASARLQHDFFQLVAERRKRPAVATTAVETLATAVESDAAQTEPALPSSTDATQTPAPPQVATDTTQTLGHHFVGAVSATPRTSPHHESRPDVAAGAKAAASVSVHRFVQCDLLQPAVAKVQTPPLAATAIPTGAAMTHSPVATSLSGSVRTPRQTGEWIHRTRGALSVESAAVQAAPSTEVKATQTNVTTDPDSIFVSAHGNLSSAARHGGGPVPVVHEQLLELHHSPVAEVRRGFSAHRRIAKELRSSLPTGVEAEPSFFLGEIPDSSAAARPASALSASHHQQGGKPQRRRVGSANSAVFRGSSEAQAASGALKLAERLAATPNDGPAPVQLVEGLADRSKIMAFLGAGAELRPTSLVLESVANWSRYPIALQQQQQQQQQVRAKVDDSATIAEADADAAEASVPPRVPGALLHVSSQSDGRPPTPATIDTRQHMHDVFLGGGRGAAVRGVKEKLQKSVDVAAFMTMFGEDHFKPVPTNSSPNTTPYIDTRPRRKGAKPQRQQAQTQAASGDLKNER